MGLPSLEPVKGIVIDWDHLLRRDTGEGENIGSTGFSGRSEIAQEDIGIKSPSRPFKEKSGKRFLPPPNRLLLLTHDHPHLVSKS